MKIKIRFHSWWWGRWVYSGSRLDGSIVTIKTAGFEAYDEAKHGLHNAE